LIKNIIFLILITFTAHSNPGMNELKIISCDVRENNSSDFSLNYLLKNPFNTDSFSALQVTLPFEKYILQGTIEKDKLKEKDFLFSQMNIDINGDSDAEDLFNVKIINKIITIDKKKISPLIKTTSNYKILLPFDEAGNLNINKISENGKPFTLRNFSSETQELIIGFNTENNIEFKKLQNSILLIEVITPSQDAGEYLLIDGQKPAAGFTNEKELTGGELFRKFTLTKNINIQNNKAKGEIKIQKINKPFSLRVTYYFSISEKIVLFSQKVIQVN